jgi:hypothetical protein
VPAALEPYRYFAQSAYADGVRYWSAMVAESCQAAAGAQERGGPGEGGGMEGGGGGDRSRQHGEESVEDEGEGDGRSDTWVGGEWGQGGEESEYSALLPVPLSVSGTSGGGGGGKASRCATILYLMINVLYHMINVAVRLKGGNP